MNEDLIKVLENLTESVRNLNGHIKLLEMAFTTTESKLNYLSGKLDDSTKAIQKLTAEVNELRFK